MRVKNMRCLIGGGIQGKSAGRGKLPAFNPYLYCNPI